MAKKKSNIAGFIKFIAIIFALGAFALMFANQLKTVVGNTTTTYAFDKVLFDYDKGLIHTKGATGSFVGYILIATGALVALVSCLLKPNLNKLLSVCAALLMIAGAVLVFMVVKFYLDANSITGSLAKPFKIEVAPVISGVLASLGGLATCASAFTK